MKSRVLLATSDTEILQSLPLTLTAAGHRVKTARSGMELLNKARRLSPNLIILDANLPDMDGTTVCDILSLLPSTHAVPRIFLAPRPKTFLQVPPGAAAPRGDVVPPFNPEELLQRVAEVFGEKRGLPGILADLDADLDAA